jgi:hypothetical protein
MLARRLGRVLIAIGVSAGLPYQVERLIRAYESRGHNIAELDPLGILDPDLSGEVRLTPRCRCAVS